MESTTYTINGKEFELKHHGIKGMKWGVRRYQKKDGSLTAAGKKRYGESSNEERSAKNRQTAKRVAAALVMTASVGVAVAAYRKNPAAINSVLAKVGKSTVTAAKKAGKVYNAGKQFMKDAKDGVKEGFDEVLQDARANAKSRFKAGVKEAYFGAKAGVKAGIQKAPQKAVETVITGATMMAAKRILDATVGKEEAARIFQANNKKKIGSFWKVSQDDRSDDD